MRLYALLAVLAVFIAGCASSGNSGNTATTVSDGDVDFNCPPEYKNAAPVETDDSITYKVCSKSFSFEPHTINAKMGKKVIIDAYSPDIPHSLVITELEVNERLPTGQKTIEFTPSKKGEFDVICTVPGHKEAGMISKIVVE